MFDLMYTNMCEILCKSGRYVCVHVHVCSHACQQCVNASVKPFIQASVMYVPRLEGGSITH